MKVLISILLFWGSASFAFEKLDRTQMTCAQLTQAVSDNGAIYLRGWGWQIYTNDVRNCRHWGTNTRADLNVAYVSALDGWCQLQTCRYHHQKD